MEKIGLFIGSLEGGGAERVVLNLANEFHNRNIPFVLILRFKKGPYVKELNAGIKVVELNANNPFLIIYSIVRVCKINNIDTLLTVSRYNNILGLIANRFLKRRIVIREADTINGLFKDKGIKRIKSYIVFYLMKHFYPSANKIIANSNDTEKDIKKHVISSSKVKTIVINNPLFNNKIKSLSKEAIDNEDFLSSTTPRIISIGRLEYKKNYQYLIKSLAIVKDTISNISLIILGNGTQIEELKQLSKQLNLENNVHFLGFVDNPYKYLKASDVFVLSSLYEGFGNVLVEALSVGLPVVSTDCPGGPREILNDGEFGTLVPLNDINAMAEAIIDTLNKKHDKSLLIKRANFYSIDKIASEYYKILRP